MALRDIGNASKLVYTLLYQARGYSRVFREQGRKLSLPRGQRPAASGFQNQSGGDSAFAIQWAFKILSHNLGRQSLIGHYLMRLGSPRKGDSCKLKMKILLTADLHCNSEWFSRVEDQASEYELISIAGDLLNIFSKVPIEDQLALVKEFLRRLTQKTSVAVCSGNHDQIEVLPPLVAGADAYYAASWLEEIGDAPGFVGNGQTRRIGEQLIVTTIPFFIID